LEGLGIKRTTLKGNKEIACKGVNLITLAVDTDKWWALANTVMRLRVLKIWEIS
jgi:hypothetical protein